MIRKVLLTIAILFIALTTASCYTIVKLSPKSYSKQGWENNHRRYRYYDYYGCRHCTYWDYYYYYPYWLDDEWYWDNSAPSTHEYRRETPTRRRESSSAEESQSSGEKSSSKSNDNGEKDKEST